MNADQPPIDPNGQEADDQFDSMPVEEPRRAASVTLRDDEEARARGVSMEVANQSLADALRIVYRLLQVVMVALVLLFIFSGLQQVNEGERGVLLTFGKASPDEVEPGFVMSWPQPLGEVIKIPTGTDSMDLLESFWPDGVDPSRPNDGAWKRSLVPGVDGALLTGDNNIVHAQLTVSFNRSDAGEFVRNIYTDHLNGIIRAVVERAAVQVVASVQIDDLLRRGLASTDETGRESSVEARIRDVAQRALDEMNAGLSIDRVTIREVRPPPSTADEFNMVNEAVTAAATERVAAERQREEQLTALAGSGYRPLLAMIDEYERVLELEGEEPAEQVLNRIWRLIEGDLDGQSIEIGGKRFDGFRIAGQVSGFISAANQYRTAVVENAENQAATFQAKLEQYRANPQVFLTSQLTNAMIAFLSRSTVQSFRADGDIETLLLRMNADPEVQRRMEREAKAREIEQSKSLQRAWRAGEMPGQELRDD